MCSGLTTFAHWEAVLKTGLPDQAQKEGNVDMNTSWLIFIPWFCVTQAAPPLFWNGSPEISILPLSFLAVNSFLAEA